MINEGNSLAELQAKVLRASPHETKSASLWTELLDRSPQWSKQFLKQLTESSFNRMYLADWYSPARKPFLLKPFVPKVSAKVISVDTSPLVGRYAELITFDDIT